MLQKEVPRMDLTPWHENQNLGARLGGELQVCIGAGSKPEAEQGCDYTNKKIPVRRARFPCKKKNKELLRQ